jgi:hypothetical protein
MLRTSRKHLLLAGNDIQLLHTQVLLFQLAGFEVVVVFTPADARLALTDFQVQGVVLGRSLSFEDRAQIAFDASAIRPGVAILELATAHYGPEHLVTWARSIGWAGADQAGSSRYGPTA